jgi:hypothetical protein
MLGTELVQVQSYQLSRPYAAIAAVALLLGAYLASYRAAIRLEHLLGDHLKATSPDTFYGIRFQLIADTSISNPFSSTEIRGSDQPVISDYIGVLMIHVPILIVLVTSIWVTQESRQAANTHIEFDTLVDHMLTIDPSTLAAEDMEQLAQEFVAQFVRKQEAFRVITLRYIYSLSVITFLVLYGAFLWRVGSICAILNYIDFRKRVVCLAVPFLISAALWTVLDLIHSIRLVFMYANAG